MQPLNTLMKSLKISLPPFKLMVTKFRIAKPSNQKRFLRVTVFKTTAKFPYMRENLSISWTSVRPCSPDGVVRRHTIQGCVEYPVLADDQQLKSNIHVQGSIATGPEMHQTFHCDEYPVYVGPDKHQIELCPKCSVPVQDFEGHRASQCSCNPVYNGPDRHHLAACAEFPGVNAVQEHQISRCSRYPVFAGIGPAWPSDLCIVFRGQTTSDPWHARLRYGPHTILSGMLWPSEHAHDLAMLQACYAILELYCILWSPAGQCHFQRSLNATNCKSAASTQQTMT